MFNFFLIDFLLCCFRVHSILTCSFDWKMINDFPGKFFFCCSFLINYLKWAEKKSLFAHSYLILFTIEWNSRQSYFERWLWKITFSRSANVFFFQFPKTNAPKFIYHKFTPIPQKCVWIKKKSRFAKNIYEAFFYKWLFSRVCLRYWLDDVGGE